MNQSSMQTNNTPTAKGQASWRCPSNIALVKYWGKKGKQIASNPSISFTLNDAHTDMHLAWQSKSTRGIELEFLFEGQVNEAFGNKIVKFLESVLVDMPFLEQYSLRISSTNSFPHSTGIASSASSMSALAMCLCSMEAELKGLPQDVAFCQRASHVARLASGSACRSVYGGLVQWGATAAMAGSSDLYGTPLKDSEIHPEFKHYKDAVLIVSRKEKAVSSRAGHALMDGHPYAEARYADADKNLAQLLTAIREGDVDTFIRLVEHEALSLHALMMVSNPSVVLFKPNTWEIINRLRTFRQETSCNVCFTLDAGPNVHILYPESASEAVETFIKEELVVYCEGNYWIADRVGSGPLKLGHD
jgi:diphosphomevalonate decarboxylase